MTWFLVAAGGALGAVARYGLGLLIVTQSAIFPVGTLVVNLAGCFVMGSVYALSARVPTLSPYVRLFVATGFCGGFTTMSAFVFELDGLVREREALLGSAYVVATFVGSFALFGVGTLAVRLVAGR